MHNVYIREEMEEGEGNTLRNQREKLYGVGGGGGEVTRAVFDVTGQARNV